MEKETPTRDVIWLHGDTSALSALILVVIGIKLVHVDTALKGEKTTSHLLFNLSLFSSRPFFQTSGAVCLCCCLCYGVAWRSSLAWQTAVPRAVRVFREADPQGRV